MAENGENLISAQPRISANLEYAPTLKVQKFNKRPGARFSKVPVTFRARNQIFKSKCKNNGAGPGELLHFVSLADSFIMLDAKLLKRRSLQ